MIATRFAGPAEASDTDLVAAVRDGNDAAFEELYERYSPRIAAYVRGMVRDQGRAEELTQEAFLSALRRLRETDAEIVFKPWIYRIARNQAIDHHRRSSRIQEISMDADAGLRPSDHMRLVDAGTPHAALAGRERLDHLCGAFDELSDIQARVIVMRELEGLSYREIGEQLDLTRAAVESALFRARRRLETEFEELSEGRRCAAMRTTIARLAEGVAGKTDEARLARHARRCAMCRRRARELGVEPLSTLGRVRRKVAALLPLPLPLPWGPQGTGSLGGLIGERAAALAAIAAIGAGGAAVGMNEIGAGSERPADSGDRVAEQRRAEPAAARTPVPVAGARRPVSRLRSGGAVRRGGSGRERRSPDGAAPAPAGSPAAPAPTPGAAGTQPQPGPAASGPAVPSLPDVRSVAPLPKAPPVKVPQVPQLPQLPASGAPGASLPPEVVNGVNGVVGQANGVIGGVNGALAGADGAVSGALP
jgi:RNA polymerase sigma factor (sigma-70 family)